MLGLYFLLFSLSLDVAYVHHIHPAFYYSGLDLDVSLEQKIPIKVVVFLVVGFLMHMFGSRDKMFIFYFSCLVLAPIGVIFSVGGGDEIFFYVSVFFVVILMFIVKFNIVVFPMLYIPRGAKLSFQLALLVFVFYFIVVKFPGVISLFDFEVEQVALRRFVFSEYYNKVDVYVLVWVFSVILPFLLWRSLLLEKRYSASLFFFLSLLSLVLTFRKEFYLITAFVIAIYVYRAYSVGWLYSILFFSMIIAIVFYGDQFIIRYFINRQFISVGANQYFYYELASKEEFVLFSNSFLKYFINYPYDNTIPKIIGAVRYKSEFENSSNAGVIGAAYVQGGLGVVMLYAVVVGLVYNQYKLFDKCLGLNSVSIFSLIFVYKLTNNDLLTALFTGGILTFFIVVIVSGKARPVVTSIFLLKKL